MPATAKQLKARWETDDGRERLSRVKEALKNREDWASILAEFPHVDEVGNGRDLRGANLAVAHLRGADLRGADLSEADLSHCNLTDTKLARAVFRHAILRHAQMAKSEGVLLADFGGADMCGARLPAGVGYADRLTEIGDICKVGNRQFMTVVLGCLFALLTGMATSDVQLLTDSATTKLPVIGTSVRIVGFYVAAVWLLAGLCVYFDLSLQRLWNGLSHLPAILPDGSPLPHRAYPWSFVDFAPVCYPRLREGEPGRITMVMRILISFVLAWALVPLTLFLMWRRTLCRQDGFLTSMHLACLAVSTVAGVWLCFSALRTLRHGSVRPRWRKRRWWWRMAGESWFLCRTAAYTVALLLHPLILSWQAIYGAGWEGRRLGCRCSADFEEQEVSVKPGGWDGSRPEWYVKGASLRRRSLRHVRAHRAFLVNAHLYEADLTGADLREAHLQGADLRRATLDKANLVDAELCGAKLADAKLRHEAILRGADFQEADLGRAHLEDAILTGADLRRADLGRAHLRRATLTEANLQEAWLEDADLRDARLSGADLRGANLADARLTGADLSRADLQKALLQRAALHLATLQHADLRQANLQEAQLQRADLRRAELQGVKARRAILRDALLQHADLQRADLREADLQGGGFQEAHLEGADLREAHLEGAFLEGARLEGADLSTALGLTREQLESAHYDDTTKLPEYLR